MGHARTPVRGKRASAQSRPGRRHSQRHRRELRRSAHRAARARPQAQLRNRYRAHFASDRGEAQNRSRPDRGRARGRPANPRFVLDRRAVGNRARQAGRRQDRDADGAGARRRREFRRVGYSRDSRTHAPRDGPRRRRAGRGHRLRNSADEVRRHRGDSRAASSGMGRGRRDQGRLSALPAQGNQRPAAGVDRHDGGTRGRRLVHRALRRRAAARRAGLRRSGES